MGGVSDFPIAGFAPLIAAGGIGRLFQWASEDESMLDGEGKVPGIVADLRLCGREPVAVPMEFAVCGVIGGGTTSGTVAAL